MLALPLRRTEQLVLVVGATPEHRNDTLASLQAAFLIGGPIALLLISLGGYLLAGAALRPIESMRRRAAEISTSSLDERLPVPPADDEVSRLGRTLNEMLARLEDGLERERRFVADASHELRTPLTTLRAELELALRRSRTTQEFENSIRSAAEETDRLSRIADDLLVLARAEQGTLALRPEPTDLVDVVEKVRDRFGARAELEGRSLTVDADEAPVARVDRPRVEQALGNLVDNAFEHGLGTDHDHRGPAQLERRAARARRGTRSRAGLPRPRFQGVHAGDAVRQRQRARARDRGDDRAGARRQRRREGSAPTAARTCGSGCPL